MGATITNTATTGTTHGIELFTRPAKAAAGDYLALLGYVEMNQPRENKTVQGIRASVRGCGPRGDFQVLADRKRDAWRVHRQDVESGLAVLQSAMAKALA